MPYIASNLMREILDRKIAEAKDQLKPNGTLYYFLIKLVQHRLQNVGMSYAEVRQWLGEIEATILELVRRYGVDYICILRDLNYNFYDFDNLKGQKAEEIDKIVKSILLHVRPDGTLNYFLHALCKRTIGINDKNSIWREHSELFEFLNELITFKIDFYRDYVAKYEDKKIIENGDVEK